MVGRTCAERKIGCSVYIVQQPQVATRAATIGQTLYEIPRLKKGYYMAGKCKLCGFVGTDEMLMGHADKCPALEDCQPDIMEKTLHIAQQPQADICPTCDGRGKFPITYLRGKKSSVPCSVCGGTGKRSSMR